MDPRDTDVSESENIADDVQGFQNRIERLCEIVGGPGELAQKSHLSRRVIDKYRNGASDPSRERLAALARAADVRVGWLATGEEPMYEPLAVPEDKNEETHSENLGSRLPREEIDAESLKAADEYLKKEEKALKIKWHSRLDRYRVLVHLARTAYYASLVDQHPFDREIAKQYQELEDQLDELFATTGVRRR